MHIIIYNTASKAGKTTACTVIHILISVFSLPKIQPNDYVCKNNTPVRLSEAPVSVCYSCSVALLCKVWASGYSSAGVRALLHRQQRRLQKEWLMLLSHIQCTDRFCDKKGRGERERGAHAQPIMHMCVHACTDTLSWVLEYSCWMEGTFQMGEGH